MTETTPSELSVDLADAIAAVRRELHGAQAEGTGNDVRFAVGPVEIEFSVTVSRNAKGEATVKVLGLLSLGGGGGLTSGETNRIKVILNPVAVNGQPFEVAAQRRGRPGG